MTRAFIVNLEVDAPDNITLAGVADDIFAVLEQNGFAVESVAPWASPGGPDPSLTGPTLRPQQFEQPIPFDTLG